MKKLLFVLSLFCCGSIVNAQDTLQQYTGRYVFPDGSVVASVDVTLSGGALTMSSTSGTSTLVQLGVDSFQIVEFSGTSVFRRNTENKINAVHIEAMGYVLDGVKEENGIWIFRDYYIPPDKEMGLVKK